MNKEMVYEELNKVREEMEESDELAERKAGEMLRHYQNNTDVDNENATMEELQRAMLDASARKAVSPTGVNYHMCKAIVE